MDFDASVVLASRVLGTLVFASATVNKLRHSEEFVGVVANYEVLPESLVRFVAGSIILLEFLTAFSLGTGAGLFLGAVCAVVLLFLFAVAITTNLIRGRIQIDCGCFRSSLRQHLSPALVLRNLALIALILPLMGRAGSQPPTPMQALDGIGGGVALFTLYQVLARLLALRDAASALRKRIA